MAACSPTIIGGKGLLVPDGPIEPRRARLRVRVLPARNPWHGVSQRTPANDDAENYRFWFLIRPPVSVLPTWGGPAQRTSMHFQVPPHFSSGTICTSGLVPRGRRREADVPIP
jgi:hypothetical protein